VRDLQLDPVTGDLDVSGGKLKLTSGANRTRQRLYLRLGMVKGTWFLDASVGIPLHDKVLGKFSTLTVVESIYRRAITTCPGIASLTSFSVTLDAQRRLDVRFEARSVDGEIVTPFDAFVSEAA
jgi:hypothetical protein